MNGSVHWRTPSVSVNGPRGSIVRQVEYLRKVAGGEVEALITRQHYDVAGRLVEQRDPRLSVPNQRDIYRLSGDVISSHNVDAGHRLDLPGLAGEVLRHWDLRGHDWRTTYDHQLRVVQIDEGSQSAVERFVYADHTADAGRNQRGRLVEQHDLSGAVTVDSFNLQGLPLTETRTFEAAAYTTSRVYDALGKLVGHTDACKHRQDMRFDKAGQLRQVSLQLAGSPGAQPIMNDARYNAAGQIIEQHDGNGTVRTWAYDPATGRLLASFAAIPGQKAFQDLRYVYDRMGNPLSIEDRTILPAFFANQRTDGNSTFGYDSLYRLISATGFESATAQTRPGLPPVQPIDSNNRFNYAQFFDYDEGGNLIRLHHQRAHNHYTRHLRIAPDCNRGIPWVPGDPEPDFTPWFDRNGNMRQLQPGAPLTWNRYDQLTHAVLVERESGLNDEEQYLYSQGIRLCKRLDYQARSLAHRREVLYLSQLEIRTCDLHEALHVITVPMANGSVRCLHWEKGKPPEVTNDQLRFTLEDHLGSASVEVDGQGAVISRERYDAYGVTRWLEARSNLEVSYKTLRYSGQEMDRSGLYCYEKRYLAPWIMRWTSADPARNVDGLNLYVFVKGNPLRYVDNNGEASREAVIQNYSSFISVLEGHAAQTLEQIDNIMNKTNIAKDLAKNLAGESIGAVVGFVGGYYGAKGAGPYLPNQPHVAFLTNQSKPPFSEGLTGGNLGGELAGAAGGSILPTSSLIRPLIPQTSTMTIKEIDRQAGVIETDDPTEWLGSGMSIFMNNVVGSVVPGVSAFLAMGSRVQEAEDIQNRLDPVKINKIESMLDEWETTDQERFTQFEKAFDVAGVDVIYPQRTTLNVSGSAPAAIRRIDVQRAHHRTQDLIRRSKTAMAHYKEMGTTDNQYLSRHPRVSLKAYRK